MESKSISFIIPTIMRPTLKRTLFSINEWEIDEVVIVRDTELKGGWGNEQRNEGMRLATKDYLAFIDDDDYYVPGAREIMDKAIKAFPGRPILFKMQYPDGGVLWQEERVFPGNVSTQMILVPNDPTMLHFWEPRRNMADCIFIDKWKWKKEDIVWHNEIIALLGHNDFNK